MFMTLTITSNLYPWMLFGFTGLPLIILASVYIYRAVQNKKFSRIIIYPFIDFFRTLSFCCGQIYQLLRRTSKETEQ
jgi:hypothetical protein